MLNLCRVKYMHLSLGLISIGKDKTSATILDVAASICIATWCFNLGLRYISLKPLIPGADSISHNRLSSTMKRLLQRQNRQPGDSSCSASVYRCSLVANDSRLGTNARTGRDDV